MPVRRQGRYVETTPAELNAWLGKESGTPVHVATEDTDLTAELKRGLSFIHHEKQADKKPSQRGQAAMRRPTIRVTKWLTDIPIEATCSACAGVTFRAKGSGHHPNREEYQRSLPQRLATSQSAGIVVARIENAQQRHF